MDKKYPNLFIVGAPKSGTTSIYNFLKLNSDVYMCPIKEPHFFSKDIKSENFNEKYRKLNEFNIDEYLSKERLAEKHITFISNQSIDKYLQLFRERKSEKYTGEASTCYLFSKNAAHNIHKFNPDSKIIICLRQPLERAYSHWKMNFKSSITETSNFNEDLKKDFSVIDKTWGGESQLLVEVGLYYKQVERYLDLFGSKNVHIIIFDDLKKNTLGVIEKLFSFLEIEHQFDQKSRTEYNIALSPRNNVIKFLFNLFKDNFLISGLPNRYKKIIKMFFLKKDENPYMTNKDFQLNNNYFIDDILKLEKLINKDLVNWK